MVLFAGIILIPALGYRWLGWNGIFTFWFAYVVTRPLGASFADLVGKPTSLSGIGWGTGPIALVLAAAIVVLVALLSVTHLDVRKWGATAADAHAATAAGATAAADAAIHAADSRTIGPIGES